MAISAISGNIPQQPVATAPAPAQTAAPTQPAAVQLPKYDTVKLSGAALAKSLKLAGLTPEQIALKMGVSVQTVDDYLGISTNTASAAPLPTPAAPAAKQATTNTVVTPQAYSPPEEATESGAQKATETAQGNK